MYKYEQQVPVIFGCGAVASLGEQIRLLGLRRVMCVFDEGVRAAGIASKAENSLRDAGIDFICYKEIGADPTSDAVDRGGELALREKVDGVIGIGGGSSMDAAKGIAILMDNPAPISQYLTLPPTFLKTNVPIVLVPTTAGTGSEMTAVSVITNTATNEKLGVFVRSRLAIVDPELTVTVPPSVTAHTGMDAFCHAVESITANNRNPYSENLALAAIGKIAKYLPAAVDDGSNIEARYQMSLASNWAGIAFADADNHFGHSIADAFSAVFHTPHGLNSAWGCPELIELIVSAVPYEVRAIGRAMGADFSDTDSDADVGAKIASAIRSLMKRVKIPSPAEKGFTREQVLSGTSVAAESGLRLNCPVPITQEIAENVLGKIYDNYR